MNRISSPILVFIVAIVLSLTSAASTQYTENVLFTFNNTNGSFPFSLVRAANGDLYGVTAYGGRTTCNRSTCGVVFKLSNSSGSWAYSIIHGFTGGADGELPGSIVLDPNGNIIGSSLGGANGGGLVYKLSQVNGLWKFNILHSFTSAPSDGSNPEGGVIGPDGAFYAATSIGGNTSCGGSGCGTIFKLQQTSSGPWKKTILHYFTAGAHDGSFPNGELVFDAAGNIYGTSLGGNTTVCSSGCGTVFKLAPNSGGTYTSTILHKFSGLDGSYPGTLVQDSSGNLFGVTLEGGDTHACATSGCGTLFELSPNSTNWTFSTLYKFTYSGDGYLPQGLALDGSGNLIGIATFAQPGIEGSAFELSPNGTGGWNFNTLFLFSDPTGGGAPTSLLLDSAGNIYGTTETGGDVNQTGSGDGVVFELSPPAL